MRPKSIFLLALALGCGLIASIGISQVMERKTQTQDAGPAPTEPIYVALKDINVNDSLTPEMLKLEQWPKDKVPPGSLNKLEELEGRRPRTKIYQGEPILEAKLLSADSPDAASTQIPPGMRSVSVRVDAQSSGGGLLRPGDRVDVQLFVSRNPTLGIMQSKTVTVLQDVRVFAVNHLFRRGAEDEDGALQAQTVSLLCSPEHASKLTLASKLGEIRLVMRNPDDKTDAGNTSITARDLLDLDSSDREQESESLLPTPLPPVEPDPPHNELAQVPIEPAVRPWTMILMEGHVPREVEFPEDGRLPQDTGRAVPQSSFPMESADAPEEPAAEQPSVPDLPPPSDSDLDKLNILGE